jgi:hypothetical protein
MNVKLVAQINNPHKGSPYYCAGLRYDGGMTIALVKDNNDKTFCVEVFKVVNNSWQFVGVKHSNDNTQAWQQAQGRIPGEGFVDFLGEEEYSPDDYDEPIRIFSYSEVNQSTSIVVCCSRTVHIWRQEEIIVFTSPLLGEATLPCSMASCMSDTPVVSSTSTSQMGRWDALVAFLHHVELTL